MSEPRVPLGDLKICDGEPPDGNPWKAPSSHSREEALHRAVEQADVSAWTYWHVPYGGGVRRLTDPFKEIDWTSMRARPNRATGLPHHAVTGLPYPYRADGSLRNHASDF